MTDPFERREHSLENQFFYKADQELLEKIRQQEREKAGRETLARVTGIRNAEVIEELLQSGIRAESLIALSVVPLVFLAWADRVVTVEEREAILEAAGAHGMEADSASHQLLSQWLEHQPKDSLLEAWRHYIHELPGYLGPEEFENLRYDILERARKVMSASGGILQVESVSAAQQRMLAHIESAFVNSASEFEESSD